MVETATRRVPVVPNTEWLTVRPPAVRLAFYGNRDAQLACESVWGTGFSEEACRAIMGTSRATLWLGPDEYLLIDAAAGTSAPAAGLGGAGALALELESALTGLPHALVDVSHRQFAIEVSGPFAATILSGACPLDLDLAQFPVGMCTRTVFAKADIVLWRTAADAFHIEVWRSFSGYVTGVLREIAAEFYPGR
jgi:sarcosine oxidase subunit gamma